MWLLFYEYEQVARHAIALARVALTVHRELHALSHASGDLHGYDLLGIYDTLAATVGTLVLDDLTLTIASGTYALSLHHAEDALLGTCYRTRSMTFGTGLSASAALSTCATTVLTGYILLQLELLLYALGDLLERELHLDAEVRSAEATCLLALSATTTEATKSAEATMTTEDVAKHREDVVHRHILSAIAATSSATHASVAKLVVASALVLIAQHLVGLSSLLKLILGLLVTRVAVGVILDGHLLICFLDLVGRRLLVDTEDLVVISLFHVLVLFN